MGQSRLRTIHELLRPHIVRWTGWTVGAIGLYDVVSNQFPNLHLPKLGDLLPRWIAVSGSLLPWWGWLLILQAILVYALFEYVRKQLPIQQAVGIKASVNASLTNRETQLLAGALTYLGEIVREDGFRGVVPNTKSEIFFNDIHNSSHIIWTDENAKRLRRKFGEHVRSVIAANKAKNAAERDEAIVLMDETIEALSKILLGHS
jgi:hypothetical protein